MAINFPDSPSNNDTYTDPVNGNRYIYDSANSAWKSASTFQYSVTISSTAPGSPQQGTLWWNQDYGRLLVYYQDANTSQWVDAAPADDKTVIFGVANGAFGKANTALQNTSGTFAGTLTVAANVIAANVGAGFTPPAGSYFVAGADMARGLSVANDRTTHLRYDNNGLNYIFVENFGISAVGHGIGFQFRANSVSSTDTGYVAGSLYAVASGTYSSAATANSHLTFGTVLQNNLNERMRITDTGYVGIGTSQPASPLNIITSSSVDTSGAVGKWTARLNDSTPMAAGVGAGILFQGDKGTGTGNFGGIAGLKENSTSGNESGYLAFYTTPNSTQLVTERMRLNSLGYLTVSNQPKFWINGSAGMTATTTATKMNFTGTQYDNAGGWSDASDRYTAQVAGYYYIYTKVNIGTSANYTYVYIYKNGSQHTMGYVVNNQRSEYWVNHIVQLNVNDYVEIFTQTNTGTNSIDNSGYFGGYLLG